MPANVYSPPPRRFVPPDLKLDDFSDVEPLYRQLIDRPIASADELERWIADMNELWAFGDEVNQRRYIAKSCQTDDPALDAAFLEFVEEIEPKIKPLYFQLERKLLASPHLAALAQRDRRYAMLERKVRASHELYRDENVPLQTEATKVVNDYEKTCGAMMVTFRGAEYTLPQLARFQEETDRAAREEAWRLTVERRLRDREAVESQYERLLSLRHAIARNAGKRDFREYAWMMYERFDYRPDDCLAFADATAECVVPLVHELNRQRARDLGLERLRPWDTLVDVEGRPPLRPFAQDDIGRLVDGTRQIFARMSPQLADDFESLRANLDLASRKGKQPGGYQCTLPEARDAFIFMNAAGLQRDVTILLHEGGHAFHTIAARVEPLVMLSFAPCEFCEVASMSMEMLGTDHMDVFYANPADAARARRDHFELVIRVLPWIATIDSFQHWLYTHPGHTRTERTDEWRRLLERFGVTGGLMDWSGLDDARDAMWQRQLHLFSNPFYFVEYAIAQLGALQLWMKSKENPRQALANYRAALALGGTRPLPELFAAAGIRFDFSEKTLRPLMNAVREELQNE